MKHLIQSISTTFLKSQKIYWRLISSKFGLSMRWLSWIWHLAYRFLHQNWEIWYLMNNQSSPLAISAIPIQERLQLISTSALCAIRASRAQIVSSCTLWHSTAVSPAKNSGARSWAARENLLKKVTCRCIWENTGERNPSNASTARKGSPQWVINVIMREDTWKIAPTNVRSA